MIIKLEKILLPALLLCLIGFGANANAQGEDLKKVTLQDLSFMAGKWQGNLGSSLIEEHWSAPAGNNMIGMFRLMRGEKASMYEINAIEKTPQGLVLRIRHFGAGLAFLDEKDEANTFTLVEFATDKAVFEAMDKHAKLIYHRLSAAELTITLDQIGKDGKRSSIAFKFKAISQ